MAFADCADNVPAPLTPEKLCEGFSNCNGDGIKMNSFGFNSVVRWIESVIDALPVPDGSETHIIASPGVVVTGTGTAANPYVVGLDLPALANLLCTYQPFRECMGAETPAGNPPVAPAHRMCVAAIEGQPFECVPCGGGNN